MWGGALITDAEIATLTPGSYICGSSIVDLAVLKTYEATNLDDAKANPNGRGVYNANGKYYLVKADKAPVGRSQFVMVPP
jgi:hypothetical protein